VTPVLRFAIVAYLFHYHCAEVLKYTCCKMIMLAQREM